MSAIAELFDRLTTRRRAREISSQDRLATAAKRVAAGETVDDNVVEESLFATGQSVDDFRRLCEQEEKRRECFSKMKIGAAAKPRLDKLEQQLAAESAKFAEIRQAYEARSQKLVIERLELLSPVDSGNAARDWLLDPRNVLGPLGTEYKEALKVVEALEESLAGLQRNAKDSRQELTGYERELEALRSEEDRTLTDGRYPVARKPGDAHTRPLPAATVERLEALEVKRARLVRKLEELKLSIESAVARVAPAKARVVAVQNKLLSP